MLPKFESSLRTNGRSITRARSILFTYLQEKGPVSPHSFIEDNLGVADRASLYRSLQMFKQIGVVEERIGGGKRVIELTDTYNSHHHHLTCNHCGKSIVVTMPEIEKSLSSICNDLGFTVQRHTIEIDGLCTDCTNKK